MSDGVKVDDLAELWRAGKVNLPTVAIQYSEMASQLHQTAQTEQSAFTRSIGGLGPLYDAWTDLRNLMQDHIAVKSHDNLVAAGEALAWTAEAYATEDHLNGQQLDRFNDEIDDITSDPDRPPPPYIPSPPTSDSHQPDTSIPTDPNGPM